MCNRLLTIHQPGLLPAPPCCCVSPASNGQYVTPASVRLCPSQSFTKPRLPLRLATQLVLSKPRIVPGQRLGSAHQSPECAAQVRQVPVAFYIALAAQVPASQVQCHMHMHEASHHHHAVERAHNTSCKSIAQERPSDDTDCCCCCHRLVSCSAIRPWESRAAAHGRHQQLVNIV